MNRRILFALITGVILFSAAVIIYRTYFQDSPKRRFHLINLSLPKTGSTSIASIFRNYRSIHEAMHMETVNKVLDWREGKITGEQLDKFLLERDKKAHYPEVDSATFLHFAIDRIVKLFPEAIYLICVRNGDDWIVSIIGNLLQYFGPNGLMSDDGFLPPGVLPEGYLSDERPERIYIGEFALRYAKVFSAKITPKAFRDTAKLRENILPMLDDFARFWGENTLRSLERTPIKSRLVVRTRDLSKSLDRLARFTGQPPDNFDISDSHKNKDRQAPKIRKLIGEENIARAIKPWQEKIDAELRKLSEQ